MKENRFLSFLIITIIYVLATVVGVLVWRLLPFAFWLNLLLADVAATIFVFIFSCIFKNASVYDPYWSVQPPVILTLFAIGQELTLAKLLLLGAVWIWGIRLTGNWAYTFPNLSAQDWRYTQYEKKAGKWYPIINLAGIHLFPTVIVYGCILPAVIVMRSDVEGNIGSVLFFLLSVGSVLLEFLSDKAMHQFRKEKTGSFIRIGLWKYSRHPNYLGEICMWWTVGLSACCVLPFQWYFLAGAIANTLLFLTVSIPLADGKQASKPGFEEYKNETRMLLPFAKSANNSEDDFS